MNERIIKALEYLNCPVVPNTYSGNSQRYIVFFVSSSPVNFADDAPQNEKLHIIVHYICPTDYDCSVDREHIKKLLFQAGFIYPSEENASDENGQDYMYTTEDAEGIDYGEF